MLSVRISLVAVAAALTLAACGGGGSAKSTPSPSPSTPSPAALPGIVHPSEAQRAAYLRQLAMIAPRLAGDQDRAVSHGRDVCLDLHESEDLAVKHAAARDGVSAADARRIVSAARTTLCAGSATG